jgi:hypothetical protein
VADVRDLARKAGITPTTTRVGPKDSLLAELAPGVRVFQDPPLVADLPVTAPSGRRGSRGGKPKTEGRATAAKRRPRSDNPTGTSGRHTDMATFSAATGAGSRRRGR